MRQVWLTGRQDSTGSLTEYLQNVRLDSGSVAQNQIGVCLFIFKNKSNETFVPISAIFAYNPGNDVHVAEKDRKILEVRLKAEELRVDYKVVNLIGDTQFNVLTKIGGIDHKSAQFPPAPKSNWLSVTICRPRAKKVKLSTSPRTRSHSGSSL